MTVVADELVRLIRGIVRDELGDPRMRLDYERGKVVSVSEGQGLATVALGGSEQPTSGVLIHPGLGVVPRAGDEVTIKHRRDGMLVMDAVLGYVPDADTSGELPTVIFRATGGDDAPAFQALLAEIPQGTTVLLPDQQYLLASEVWVDKSNIAIVGRGQAQAAYGGSQLRRVGGDGTGAVLRWGTRVEPPYTSAPLTGGLLTDVTLAADFNAEYGLHLRTLDRLHVQRVWATNATVACAFMDTYVDVGGAYNNTAFCVFDQLFTYATETGKGIRIGGTFGVEAKVYGLTFRDTYISHEDGIGLDMDTCDSLEFYNTMTQSRGTGNAIEYGLYASAIGFFGSNGVAGPIVARASGVEQTRGALILGLSTEDHTGIPQPEVGARLRYLLDTGRNTLAPDPRSYVLVRDDFLTNQGGEYEWAGKSDGGAGSHAKVASEVDHPGISQLTTNAASGAAYALVFGEYGGGGVGTILASEWFEATFIFNAPSITSDRIRVGLLPTGAEATDVPSQGIYLEYIAGTDTNWMLVTKSGGAETRASTGVAATTGWWRIALLRKSSTMVGLRIGNVVNDNTQATSTTNIPTTLLNPSFVIKTTTASAKTLKADLFQLEMLGLDR
jgi:hypothetical protein